MKQMPPRCCARCSTASRSRRGPLGPTISQSDALRKRIVGQRLAEVRVVDSEILVRDARLGHAGAAAGLEDVDRLVGVGLGHPAPHRSAAQPFVFERAEPVEVVVAGDVRPRIERELLGALEPERTAGGRIEMPAHDIADVRVEPFARRLYVMSNGRFRRVHGGILSGGTVVGGRR